MEDENVPKLVIKIGNDIGIRGVTSCERSVEGGTNSLLIKRSGTAARNLIPLVIVVCEDALASTVLELMMGEIGGGYKIVTAGAWDNMPALLYGIYFYRGLSKDSGDKRYLEVICVLDGDIKERFFRKGMDSIHRGVSASDDVKMILNQIEADLVNFKLERAQHYGLPEYNHKTWLEEISDEVIDAYHEARLSELKGSSDNVSGAAASELFEIEAETSEAKRIINCSRDLVLHDFENGKNKFDFHGYYKKLEDGLAGGNSFFKYPLHSGMSYCVLKIIIKYNSSRWESYVAPVKAAIKAACVRHEKMYRNDRLNYTELGDGESS